MHWRWLKLVRISNPVNRWHGIRNALRMVRFESHFFEHEETHVLPYEPGVIEMSGEFHTAILDAEIRGLDDREIEERADALVVASRRPVNGEVSSLDRRIEEFERVFGFSSTEMRSRLSNGSLPETDAICRWLMTLSLRERLVLRASKGTPAR